MKLLTKEVQDAFKKQGYTGDKSAKDIQVICKLFNPCGAGTWWLFEDLGDGIFMAFADLGDPMCAEIGTISIHELESLKLPFGMKIERDISVKPFKLNLAEVIEKVKDY